MLSRLTYFGLHILAILAVTMMALRVLPPPAPPPSLPKIETRITRGPQSESDRIYEQFMKQTMQLPPERSSLFWLQQQASSAISVNAEIPVWGVFLAILGGVGAFFALREQLKAHVKNDEREFKEVKETLRDIERDVKAIARRDMKAFAQSAGDDDQ